jgi:hypothetical protein
LRTALRIRDLGSGDFVEGLRLPPHLPVLDMQYGLRCRECDRRGRVVVSIKWGDQ